MRSLGLILLAVGAMAAPQASLKAAVTSPSVDSPAGPPTFPTAGAAIVSPPSTASENQPTTSNSTSIKVLKTNYITVIGVLDKETKEEVEDIAEGYNRLRNLGVLDLQDEHFEEEGVEAGAATFKIKKLIKLAKIAIVVLASQNLGIENFSNVDMQMQQILQLLNQRDSGVASNALEVVNGAAQKQSNVAEQEEEATRRVAAVLAQATDTAVASLQGAAHGQVLFAQSGGATVVMGTIFGLRPGQHQLSIYEHGNCRVPGQRFDHSGGGESSFGTVRADDTGRATILLRSTAVALTGPRGVLGRTVLVAHVVEGRNRPQQGVRGTTIEGRNRPQQGVRGTTYAAAGQFVPSLDTVLADDESKHEEFSGGISCGIIVRE